MESPKEEIPHADNLLLLSPPKNSFFQSFTSPNNTEVSSDTFTTNCTAEHATSAENLHGTVNSKTLDRGGFTCCVPLCYNNSKRNKDLSFYVIPKDDKLKKIWLSKISRKNFKPDQAGHRVCSAHFKDGKRTYMNNVPTIVPKTIGPTPIKKRTSMTSLGLKRKLYSPEKPKESELTKEVVLQHEIQKLEGIVSNWQLK